MNAGHRKPPWSESTATVLQAFRVDAAHGLEESDALKRRGLFGLNQLRLARPRHLLSILAAQFQSIVVVLLVAAGALAAMFAGLPEALAIAAVIVINATTGFVSEWRGTRSMEALGRLVQVTCVVLRDGIVRHIAAEYLVPGDIVQLEAGDIVPADIRVIGASKLSVNESALTGESLPVSKHADALPVQTTLLDRGNMLFQGTSVTRGSARGVVIATGMQTEFGKILEQVGTAASPRTPLEKTLDVLGRRLAWAVILVGVVIAVGGIAAGREAFLAVQVAIALAVAAIPEGLPIVATIALARGMWRMAQRNALITRLSAVETLGATSIILTDKTGTLTENRMAATSVLTADGEAQLESEVTPMPDSPMAALLTVATLCNNATLPAAGLGHAHAVGDPTEIALLEMSSRLGVHREPLLQRYPEIHEDPFDPDCKRMATVHRSDGRFLVAVKGAPETIIPGCKAEHSKTGITPLNEERRRQWLDRVGQSCRRGLRVIAVADKYAESEATNLYDDLVLCGVVGLEDPPRAGIAAAIERCRDAGIRVIMVTGDHAATAKEIAAAVGITDGATGEAGFIDGDKLDETFRAGGQREFAAARVISRVTPEQKLRLINFYQQQGHVVAMTGDGVNDAPALKQADIGIAMGLRGTAIAREAAAMVLQDDDFGSIVAAIDHGRTIFENIRKFVVYLLSCNTSEIFIIGLATLAGAPLPLLPLQILFLNLVTDVFPALALGVGPANTELMKSSPRPFGEQILTRYHWVEISFYALVMALTVLATMAVSVSALGYDRERAVTIAFLTMALAQLWHVFNMRSALRQAIDNEVVRNVWVWAALGVCVVLIILAVYTPWLAGVMQLSQPGAVAWSLVLGGSVVPLLTAPLVRHAAVLLTGNRLQPGS